MTHSPNPWARPGSVPSPPQSLTPSAGPSPAPQPPAPNASPFPPYAAPQRAVPDPTVGPFNGPETAARRAAAPRSHRGGLVALTASISLVVGALAGGGAATVLHLVDDRPAAIENAEPQADPVVQHPDAPAAAVDTVAVANAVLPSTVTIQVRGQGDSSSGSGVVLDTDGHILTNNHVIESAAEGGSVDAVFQDGRRVRAEIIGRSPSYDLAVIKVEGGDYLSPATLGDSASVRTGQPAVAVGSPLGLGGSVTTGIVSSLDRPVQVASSSSADAATAYINAIQTDAAINPGNSGGPLVDANGRVIGINSAILTLGRDAQSGSIGLGFAIPINQAKIIASELQQDGEAEYPIIGAQVNDTRDESGVELVEVTAGGPASNGGLRPGDKITTINGTAVYNSTELIVQIRTHRPGDTVTLEYERAGTTGRADVTLDGRVG